jgi:hypothetical protein
MAEAPVSKRLEVYFQQTPDLVHLVQQAINKGPVAAPQEMSLPIGWGDFPLQG